MARYDNEMTAHVWAQQNTETGKSHNGNLWFSGPTIYSNRRAIAVFGDKAIMVTSRRYSTTTSSKHMPAVQRALGYGDTYASKPIFYVPDIDPRTQAEHAANIEHYTERYSKLIRRAGRMTGTTWQTERAERIMRTATEYARTFNVPFDAPDVAADIAAANAKRAAALARYNAPGAAAKRNAESLARAQAKERAAEEKRRLEMASAAEKLAAWRNGANVSLPYGVATRNGANVSLPYGMASDEHGGALLRVRGDKLETSLGAVVPLDDAIRIYHAVKRLRSPDGGADIVWRRNGETLPVGHFNVDHICANGTFRAGCHLINWPEIEQAARAAGVAE